VPDDKKAMRSKRCFALLLGCMLGCSGRDVYHSREPRSP
jgi:hypothetical protein